MKGIRRGNTPATGMSGERPRATCQMKEQLGALPGRQALFRVPHPTAAPPGEETSSEKLTCPRSCLKSKDARFEPRVYPVGPEAGVGNGSLSLRCWLPSCVLCCRSPPGPCQGRQEFPLRSEQTELSMVSVQWLRSPFKYECSSSRRFEQHLGR